MKNNIRSLFIFASIMLMVSTIEWSVMLPVNLNINSRVARAAVSSEPPPTTTSTWTALRHDSGRTGFNPDETVLGPELSFYDRIPAPDPDAAIITHILADGDQLYVQNLISIWAFDQDTHELQWFMDDCLDPTAYCTLIGYAVVSGNNLYVVKQNLLEVRSELVRINTVTGLVEDTYDIPNNDLFPVFTVFNNSVWLMWQYDGYNLIRLNQNLTPLTIPYNNSFDGAFAHGGLVAVGDRLIYAHGDEIIVFSITQNQEEWRITDTGNTGGLGYDLVALDDVLLVAQGERVFALDPNDSGAELWSNPAETCSPGYDPNHTLIATDGTYLTVNGLCNQDVVTYQVSDGTEIWRKSIGPFNPTTALALANGVYYVTAAPSPTEYSLYLYDQSNGTLLQQMPLGANEVTNVLAISKEFLYTGSANSDDGVRIYERTPADLSAGLTEETLPFCAASVGGTLNFEFTVANDGPGQADNVEASLTLPPGDHNITTSTGGCTGGPSPVCVLGTLLAGETATINVETTPTITGTYTAEFALASVPRDPELSNNVVSQSVTIQADSGADLMATNMEVTQGIQTILNTVPLVAGKATAVRAYIWTDGPEVANVTAVLHGMDTASGTPLPGSPLSPAEGFGCITVDGDFPDRTQINETVLFELPEDWLTGDIDLMVEANPTGSIADTIPINNTFSHPVSYETAAPVCIRTYRVRTAGLQDSGGIIFDLSPPSDYLAADPDGILARALSMMPTSEIIIYPESQLLEEWEPSLFTNDDWGPYEFNADDKDDIKVLTTLWWHNVMTDSPEECIAAGARTHYMGMIHENTSGSDGEFNGKGNYDGANSIVRLRRANNGDIDEPLGGGTVAHELGHNYDRRHVPNPDTCGVEPSNPWYSPWLVADIDVNYPYDPCTLDDAPLEALDTHFGFDLLTRRVVDPSQTQDLMSYGSRRWTSDYTWDAFLQRFQANITPVSVLTEDASLLPPPGVDDILLVNGEVLSDTVRLDGMLRVPVDFVPAENIGGLLDLGTPSPYSLELLDDVGSLLITKTLSLQISPGLSSSELLFSTGIPYITETHSIRVSLDGTPVVTQTVSPNDPVVDIITPTPGQVFTDTLTISWAGSDSDPNTELSYLVQYSNDQGNTWRVLSPRVLTNTLTVDSSLLPGSLDESLVRVIASDGVNTGSDVSPLFSLTPHDPLVFIYDPDDGAVFRVGQALKLHGSGYDPEDGPIPAADLTWTLSGYGVVGIGKTLTLADLSAGVYTLTLSTLDSDGGIGQQNIQFEIQDKQFIYLPVVIR